MAPQDTADPEAFVEAKFIGPRFSGKLSISAMPELIAYEKLILDTAKQLFREDRPERRRVDPGFSKSFSLTLTKIDTGSNLAVLSRLPPENGQLILTGIDYFSRARDLVNQIIATAASGRAQFSEFASTEVLRLFERFGASLGPDDTLELKAAVEHTNAEVAVYSQKVRRTISMVSEYQYEDEHEDIGRIDSASRHNLTFSFSPVDGNRITGTIYHRPGIVDDVTYANHSTEYVRIYGTAVYNHQSKMQRYILNAIDLLGTARFDFERRLVELSQVPDGWMDGQGKAVQCAALKLARDVLRGLVWDYGFDAPYLYPTEDGGVRAEWSEAGIEASVEFESATQLYMHILRFSDDEEQEMIWIVTDDEPVSLAIQKLSRSLERFLVRKGSADSNDA